MRIANKLLLGEIEKLSFKDKKLTVFLQE